MMFVVEMWGIKTSRKFYLSSIMLMAMELYIERGNILRRQITKENVFLKYKLHLQTSKEIIQVSSEKRILCSSNENIKVRNSK